MVTTQDPYSPSETRLEEAALLIEQADALLICAGAGMGVDSGLPDFRGANGFWRAYPALARARIHFEDAATPRFFKTNPVQAWGFYGHRINLYQSTVPNAAFSTLLNWGRNKSGGFFVNTSNVDGQFQKAGYEEDRICEIHGSIMRLQCSMPCREETWTADEIQPVVDDESCQYLGELPNCFRCGSLARPNALLFEDWTWINARTYLMQLRRDAWLAEQSQVVIVEIGAGQDIPVIRRYTERICREAKAKAIRINPREPQIASDLGIGIRLGGQAAVEALASRLSR